MTRYEEICDKNPIYLSWLNQLNDLIKILIKMVLHKLHLQTTKTNFVPYNFFLMNNKQLSSGRQWILDTTQISTVNILVFDEITRNSVMNVWQSLDVITRGVLGSLWRLIPKTSFAYSKNWSRRHSSLEHVSGDFSCPSQMIVPKTIFVCFKIWSWRFLSIS